MTYEDSVGARSPDTRAPFGGDSGVLSIIAIYVLVGGMWIFFSDRVLYEVVKNAELLTRLQTFKGWFFVMATAGMLYLLIQRNLRAVHRSRQALRESEERYRSLTGSVLDTSAVGMFILDPEFRVVWINRSLERYFGLRRKDVIGRDKRELIQERIKYLFEDPEGFAEKVLATYDDNTYIENFECHLLPRLGEGIEERWLEHWSQPIHTGLYAGGRIEHYYDITERKKAEQKLRESEEKYRNVAEKSLVGVYIIQDYVFKYVNETFARIFGYTREEIENNLGPLDLTLPEDRETVQRNIEKRISGDIETIEYEIHCRRKDGEKITVNVLGSRTTYRGRPAVIGTLVDVTEKKKVEKKLSALNLQLLNLIDVNREIVSTLDLDEVLQRICAAAVKSLGVKMSWIGLVEGDEGIVPRASYGHGEAGKESAGLKKLLHAPGVKDALEKGTPQVQNRLGIHTRSEWWMAAKKRGYHSSAAMPLLSRGRVLGVLNVYSERPGYFTDDTLRILENFSYQAAIALENAKLYGEAERLREFNEKIVQNMKEGVVVEDEKGLITFINPQAEKMLGYTREDLTGEHWSKIVSKRYQKKVAKETLMRRLGISSRYECEVVRKDGKVVPIINSATPLFEKCEFRGVLSIFTDISGQKRKEERLRRKLMKYRIDWGNLYYASERRVEKGLDAFLDVIDVGYKGAVISRAKPRELLRKLGDKAPVMWLGSMAPGESIPPSLPALLDKIEDLLQDRKVILFQGLEYLISKNGFHATLKFLQDLNEIIYVENAAMIISFDSRALEEREMALLQKEASPLRLKREEDMPERYLDLLRYVYERNMAGMRPSQKDVCMYFDVTRNTARNRINYLTSRNLLRVIPRGRSRILEVTDVGKEYL
jgi:PAS domain S-box-containing protein